MGIKQRAKAGRARLRGGTLPADGDVALQQTQEDGLLVQPRVSDDASANSAVDALPIAEVGGSTSLRRLREADEGLPGRQTDSGRPKVISQLASRKSSSPPKSASRLPNKKTPYSKYSAPIIAQRRPARRRAGEEGAGGARGAGVRPHERSAQAEEGSSARGHSMARSRSSTFHAGRRKRKAAAAAAAKEARSNLPTPWTWVLPGVTSVMVSSSILRCCRPP